MIYAYTLSVNPQKVEDVFFELQKWHRQNERELNKMKFAIKKQHHMLLFTQYKEWQLKERERISHLKIVVPEAVSPIECKKYEGTRYV